MPHYAVIRRGRARINRLRQGDTKIEAETIDRVEAPERSVDAFAQRFRREAEAAARLAGRHVAVSVYDDRGSSTGRRHGLAEQPAPFMTRGRLRGVEGFG